MTTPVSKAADLAERLKKVEDALTHLGDHLEGEEPLNERLVVRRQAALEQTLSGVDAHLKHQGF